MGVVQMNNCLFITTVIITFGPCSVQDNCNLILPSPSTISDDASNPRHSLSRSSKALIESNIFDARWKDGEFNLTFQKFNHRF